MGELGADKKVQGHLASLPTDELLVSKALPKLIPMALYPFIILFFYK
jgi:hypothetical protein